MCRTVLDLEPDALGQRQASAEIDGIGLPPHIGPPSVGAALPATPGLLLAAEGAPDLGPRGPHVDVGDAAIGPDSGEEALDLAQVVAEDRGREALGNAVLQRDGVVEIPVAQHVEDRREGLTDKARS